ncbi:hypothetical protein D6777_01195 [Candidatus Woesearchaeota archaeon]|nr:MAG: hypothetical protein D6777_01195 [Candidatus Woesearchaeota archaeon]
MKIHIKDIILGGQDGLVNVLGILLAMAGATQDVKLIIIAGLAATFAESLSMAGVGYTSSVAARDLYKRKWFEEKKETENNLDEAKKEIRQIYADKGFSGNLLDKIVDKISSNKKVLIETMMKEELNMSLEGFEHPIFNAFVIGLSAIIGSLVPLLPFFFLDNIIVGTIISVIISVIALFFTGVYKAKLTLGTWWKEGIELAIVGISAAVLGYIIGIFIGKIF